MNISLKRLVELPKTIWEFYYEGFQNQSKWSRQIWLVILIKLFVMFFILKLLFFPNFLNTKYDNDQERSDYVIDQLTNPKNQ
ncbi:MAG: DUF4492 domain-containing protein [Labilibaculum antarcticum]